MGVANTQLQKLAGLQRKLLVSENKTESICKVYKKKVKKVQRGKVEFRNENNCRNTLSSYTCISQQL